MTVLRLPRNLFYAAAGVFLAVFVYHLGYFEGYNEAMVVSNREHVKVLTDMQDAHRTAMLEYFDTGAATLSPPVSHSRSE